MSTIDYPTFIDQAMRGVVRQVLQQAAKEGLPGKHHFYISFATNYPGVQLSPVMRERYPEEMTIVLQHQFWDLSASDTGFSVMLSFNNIPEKLVIPYAALTAFADPSVQFGLQFHVAPPAVADVPAASLTEVVPVQDAAVDEGNEGASAEVISLDAFRKK